MTGSQKEVVDIIRNGLQGVRRDKPVAINAGDLRVVLEALDMAEAKVVELTSQRVEFPS